RTEPLYPLMNAIRDMWKGYEQAVSLCIVYSAIDPDTPEVFDSVSVAKLSDYVRKESEIVSGNMTGFDVQFQVLNSLQNPENLKKRKIRLSPIVLPKDKEYKNRYSDILPYEHNRVKLKECLASHPDHPEECFYLNASWIYSDEIDSSNVRFIATQAPKAS